MTDPEMESRAGELMSFSADVSQLSDNQRDILAQEYDLAVIGGRLVGELEAEKIDVATTDVGFVIANPNIPAENVVSRLDNYSPRNPSQESLLELAVNLVRFHSVSRLAGLIVCGSAGVGKTHIAVGVAKQAALEGQKALYVNASRSQLLTSTTAERIARETDIVILDDLNSQYGLEAGFFRGLLAAMHDKGNGKLLVTSNYESPEKLVEGLTKGASINDAQTARLRDRIAGALLGQTVEGESYRVERQANQAPWWLSSEITPEDS